MTHDMNLFMKPRYTRWQQLLRSILLLLMMMAVGSTALGATINFNHPNGYYYLGNDAGNNGVPKYDPDIFEANFYMCPTYSTTVNANNYLNADVDKPLITTFKSFPSNGKTYSYAVWYIEAVEGEAGFFYIKHRDTGKYLVANDNNSPAANRRRVNLGPTSDPGDDGKFRIQSDDNGVTYYISSKTKQSGNNKYLNPSKGNLDYLFATSDNSNTGGILGFWNEKTTNSAWHIEPVPYEEPVISFDNTTYEVTMEAASPDATIYYTTNGSNPDKDNVGGANPTQLYNPASKPVLSEPTTIKAIAIAAGYAASKVASLTVSRVATPSFSFSEGKVIINCATGGASIYYEIANTAEGVSEPTTLSTRYSTPIVGAAGQYIKAIAVKDGCFNSNVAASEKIVFPCSKPVIRKASATTFTIECRFPTSGVTIYYTTDGTTPTTSSNRYEGAVTFNTSDLPFTVKAIAVASDYTDSEIAISKITEGLATDDEGYLIIVSDYDYSRFLTMVGSDGSDGKYKITADINASGTDVVLTSFTGELVGVAKDDGTYPVISNLDHPLFASTNNAVIKNVILKDVSISGSGNVGAIVCEAKGYTRIYNCGILPNSADFPDAIGSHPSVSGTGYVGSLVGSLEDDSRVVNCFSYADVSGGSVAGGIVGYNNFASDASETDGKYTKLRTMVVNCMYYGNISASSSYPVYGGQKISNKGVNAINNYNFYSVGCTFSGTSTPTDYNCSWPAKLEYLTRYEFHRSLLNSNRELCGWWVGAPSAPSTMTTAEVQAVPKDASLMAKWVLDPTIAPYPILKPFGIYASPINQDPDKRLDGSDRAISSNWGQSKAPDTEGQILGSIFVSISGGAHHSGSSSRMINITAMDTLFHDNCYGKIQLPYYNDIFGDPEGSTWTDKYGGNYGDYVVTGWDITTVTGGTAGSLTENWETGYNFTDRKCTAKDLKRTFAQGGYYYVPEGVTGITITAHWAKAIYFDNTDHSYDRVYMSGTTLDAANPGVHFAPAGTRPSTLANEQPVFTDKISDLANKMTSDEGVYGYALVLVGNHQYRTSRNNIAGTHNSWGFTIMSADFDLDNEPDYSLIWQLGQVYDRQSICPIRFDFLPVVEMGLAMKEDGSTQYYSLGCYRPLGHFEVTETSLIRFGQFEFSNLNRSIYAPIILNGGIYDQYCKGTNNNAFKTADDKIDYIILGGNVRMPSFTPGAHVNSNANFPTRHCAVNVLGGSIDNLYLTGNYNESITPNADNPHCYIDGGSFQQVAAAGKEGINGNVYWQINHSLIKEFYGGGTLADKRVTGNIDVTIDNSKVTKYCGGPKFGDMYDSKTVTTRATGTTFTYYYGGGNGGTSYVQYDKTDVTTTASGYNWNGTGTNQGHVNNYTPGSYRNRTTGYQANYDMEIINSSAGTEIGRAVMRTYFFAAQFSATNTGSITNSLTDCEVLTSFYGGGNLGGVNGDVTSTLTDTHVHGSAFGAGFSASVPEVKILRTSTKTAPTLNLNTAIITPQSEGTYDTYTWTNDPSLSTTNPISGDGKYFYTEVPLTNLGSVSGNVTLNIEGSSVVEGNDYTINTTDLSYSLKASNVGGVFGGGDESKVSGIDKTVEVNINNGSVNNVFGGGNNGDVASEVTVNVNGGSVTNDVFGGGKGQTTVVEGDVTVNIGAKSADEPPVYTGKAIIGRDVYGGSALGNTNAQKGTGWTKEDLKLSAVAGKNTHVNVYGGTVTGSVYGGGLGKLAVGTEGEVGYVAPIASNVYGPVTVTVEGSATGENVTAVTAANVFGCNNLFGAPQSTVNVFIKGTAAASGGTPNPIGSVYGGGNLAAAGTVESEVSPVVFMSGGTVNNIYGGGLGASAVLTGNTSVTLTGGTVNNNIFGGGDAADVTGGVSVSITGGTVTHDVYGGGALANTNTANWDPTANEGAGDWAAGKTSASHITQVSLTGGTISGDAYGGGLGDKAILGGGHADIAAQVYGDVTIELNKDVASSSKGATVSRIFGANNKNGTPKGHVTAHVYKTQNTGKAMISEKVSDPADAGYYDVQAVYGGGNEADYIPADTRQSTEVIIEDCDNTLIKDVYGGGNAAAVPATEVWILGAKKIDNVFGGGNGERGAAYAAHVGFHRLTESTKSDYAEGTGKTEVKLVGGDINVVYGGSNSHGDIRGGANILMPTITDYNNSHDPNATTCTLITQHIYGGGKNADMSSGTSIVLGCMPDGWIGEIYAGAQAADVAGDVNLTITSGKFERVFGGNKDSGKLEGSITVNIEETGNCDVPIIIGELYGGGNLADYSIYGYNNDGTIKDKATFDSENALRPEGEKATPYDDPQVNVRAFTSIGAIYGGGYSAKLMGNPSVDINVAKGSHADDATLHSGDGDTYPAGTTGGTLALPYPAHKKGEIGAIGNVFGGGNLANVIGDTHINIGTETEIEFISSPSHLTANVETGKYPVSGANITGNVYAGGNAADIIGNTTVTIGTVDLTGEGKDGTKIAGNVFGGGLGETTTVTGDIEVNIGADTGEAPAHNYVGYAAISGSVYGGSAKGKVNATKSGTEESPTFAASTGTTAVNFFGGTITGDLYGGGYGLDNAQADVYGAVTVNMYGGTVPNVYGSNNLSGATQDAVNVNISGGAISQNVYGGGNAADALGDVTVTVTGGSMTDVYGGGKGQTTVVGGDVTVNIGTKTTTGEPPTTTYAGTGEISGNVYGGSALGAVNATKGANYSSDPTDISATSGKTTAVNIYAATTLARSVFGGGLGDVASLGGDHSDIVAQNFGNTTVTMEGANVSGAVYGGANVNGVLHGDATVTISGGTVHAAPGTGDPIADVVFGGGFGQPTRVDGNVVVNIGTNTAGTLAGNATIHGNVYGGSAEGKVNGTTASSPYTTQVNLNKGTVNGAIFGGGLGTNTIAADVYGAITVTTKGGTAQDVFGCNNVNGAPQQAVAVIIDGGTVGNVYGGGKDAAYTGTPTVTVSGGTVSQNVYGGGLGATATTGGASVTISGGQVNNDVFGGGSLANVTGSVSVSVTGGKVINDVYGGGALAHTNTANWDDSQFVVYPTTNGMSLVTGLYTAENDNALITAPNTRAANATTYYQKGNWKDGIIDGDGKTTYKTTVSLTGGIVGNAYGGGLGQMEVEEAAAQAATYYTAETAAAYNATLVGAWSTIDDLTSEQASTYNTALGLTSGDTGFKSEHGTIDATEAAAYNATLTGAVKAGDLKTPATPAMAYVEGIAANVYGDVTVTVNGTAFTHDFVTPTDANGDAIPNVLDVPTKGRVFGCNNFNGTPMGNVLVEVDQTKRITDEGEITSNHLENIFEIHSVYGGGNLAHYQPATGKAAKVIINGCDKTSIEKVFGGGNSASVPSTDVLILGTFYVGYAFSGGNGADMFQKENVWFVNDGAPIYGDATIIAIGGKIGQIFGGSDTKGTVYGNTTTKLKGKEGEDGVVWNGEGYSSSCNLRITNAYGAARGADIEGDVNFIISGCSAADEIERVFGGSYDANIRGGITLTITGGIFAQVFGGNDHGGTIGGEIKVDIEETQPVCNPIVIQYLYGGGREAEYPGRGAKYITNSKDSEGNYIGDLVYHDFPYPNDGKNAKITVNVKSATRIDNIYGGCYRAKLNGDTEINLNMMKGNYVNKPITFPSTYRGDQIPNVDSPAGTYENVTSTLTPQDDAIGEPGSSVVGLYTREALETVPVTYKYTRITDKDATAQSGTDYYQLTHMTGTIKDDIGTIGNIFGGCFEGVLNGNTKVNIGTETKVQILKRDGSGKIVDAVGSEIYDSNGKLKKGKTPAYVERDVIGAHITGNVFGGGENADVTGDTEVNICVKNGATVATGAGVSIGYGCISGVSIEGGSVYGISKYGSVFGGGCRGDVLGNTTVRMSDGYIFNGIYGGGYAGSVGTFTERDMAFTGYGHTPHAGCIGKPKVCQTGTGKCTVVVNGGQIGPVEVATQGMTRAAANGGPVIEGWIWGAGQGEVEDPAVNPDTHFKTYVGSTDVTVSGSAFILEGIIGGGEFGRVLGNTLVKIEGGQIGVGAGQTEAGGTLPKRYTDDQFINPLTTEVTNSNALPECSHFDYGYDHNSNGKLEYWTYDPYYETYPAAHFTPASATHPSDGKTWIGCVFGGGSGYAPYLKNSGDGYDWLPSAGWVEGNTEVQITGGHILTNVYGGNEYTDVKGKCTVTMTGGTIGVPRTLAQIEAHPLTCYLFGAGKGDERPHFNTFNNAGSVEVNVSGGIIYGSVFGGSEDGHVTGNVVVNINSGAKIGTWGTTYVDGNVFGGGRGFSGGNLQAGNVGGNIAVNITGGTMLGSIYGGGRIASVGLDATTGEMQDGDDHGHITVDISDGTGKTMIGNKYEFMYLTSSLNTSGMTDEEIAAARKAELKNTYHVTAPDVTYQSASRTGDFDHYMINHTRGGCVYGGGMGRRELLDGTKNTVVDWTKLGSVKSTKVNIHGTNVWIKGSLFTGGEYGAVTGSHTSADSKTVGTEAIIDGDVTIGSVIGYNNDTYNSSLDTDNRTQTGSNDDSRYCYGGAYGGGFGTEIDATLSTPISEIKNFGALVSSNTSIKLLSGAVRSSLYGGGKMACVAGDTYVTVSGGTVGVGQTRQNPHPSMGPNYVLFGGLRMGNVYGGGRGSVNSVVAGVVKGNTNINITDGNIYHNIYGGGAVSSVGDFDLTTDENKASYGVMYANVPVNWKENTGVATINITGGTIGTNGHDSGMVNGSSRGDISTNQPTSIADSDPYDHVAWVNKSIVTIGTEGSGSVFSTPLIKGSVYGGGENGHNYGDAEVYVHSGTIGVVDTPEDTWSNRGSIYGAGCGTDTYSKHFNGSAYVDYTDGYNHYNPMGGRVQGNTTVSVDGGHVIRDVYGGGSMGSVSGNATVTISGGRIGTDGNENGSVYGGPKGSLKIDPTDAHAEAHVENSTVTISYATTPATDDGSTTHAITGSVYGGGEAGLARGKVTVNMNGGLIGKDLYGGGAYADTNTNNVSDYGGASPTVNISDAIGTKVHLRGGKIMGNAYGGALGRKEYRTGGAVTTTAIVPNVYGNVLVELNKDVATTGQKGCVVTNVFGCNNRNGSPMGSVDVHVYATQNDAATQIANDGSVTDAKEKGRYDVYTVYGGGNLAEYHPVGTGHLTTVTIDGCDLTSIESVYGGSNAAPAPATHVIVNGTYEINKLFGGGNGFDAYQLSDGKWYDNPGANVGYHHFRHYVVAGDPGYDAEKHGDGSSAKPYLAIENTDPACATKENRQANYAYGAGSCLTEVFGGLVHTAWGGSNQRGNIRETVESRFQDAGLCPMTVDNSYGGSNNAELDARIIAELDCVQNMDQFFGGSTNADVNSDIVLNITNGTYGQIFGGNNTNGAVHGSITINIEERGCRPIYIGELYSAGYLAPYSIYDYQKDANGQMIYQDGKPIPLKKGAPGALDTPRKDPRINIISATHIGTIYGGGYQAVVVGSPRINVNMQEGKVLAKYADKEPADFDVGKHEVAKFTLGGLEITDYAYNVESYTTGSDAILSIGNIGYIFGGGNEADIIGNTYVEIGTGEWINDDGQRETKAKADGKTYIYNTTSEKWEYEDGGSMVSVDSKPAARNAAFITGSVYGGGRMGHVGDFQLADATYVSTHPGVPVGKPISCTEGTGETHILISNGEIGPDDMQMFHLDSSGNIVANDHPDDAGHVYGGGQGTQDYYYDDTSGMTEEQKLTGMLALGSTGTTDEEKAALMDAAMNAKVGILAFVDSADVVINGTAWVKGDVFGGAENGHTLHNTGVKIGGDCQIGNGHILLTDGSGTITKNHGVNRRYTDAEWAAGRFIKQTSDPDDWPFASLPECSSWLYGDTVVAGKIIPASHHSPYDKFAGYAGYSSEGGTRIATSGHTFCGNVFGGGSGFFPFAPGHWLETSGEVEGNTWVEVTGGHILTSLYGSSEMSNVEGDTYVTMKGGTVGVPRTLDEIAAHPVTCYVFGGGMGESRNILDQNTYVKNTTVDIQGGWIYGSVFGGAEDGHVIGDAKVKISGTTKENPTYAELYAGTATKIGTWGTSYVDGNIFGGGRGYDGNNPFAGCVEGNVQLDISGGLILGSVYGGGRLGSVGINNRGVEMADTETETHGHATTTISGGIIGNKHEFIYPQAGNIPDGLDADFKNWSAADWTTWKKHNHVPQTVFDTSNGRLTHTKGGNVFAGGMGRREKLDGVTEITEIDWRKLGAVKSTSLTVSGDPWIMSCVYGGGELGAVKTVVTDNTDPENPVLEGGTTTIDIQGGTIGSEITSTTVQKATIPTTATRSDVKYTFGSVYGGGMGTQDHGLTDDHGGAVGGNTTVSISGASTQVRASVFGGGEMANVDGSTTVNISGGEIGRNEVKPANDPDAGYVLFGSSTMGNVYGGGKGHVDHALAGLVKGNTNINISGGNVYHMIYGGGAIGSVGTFRLAHKDWDNTDFNPASDTDLADIPAGIPLEWKDGTGNTTVNITGGTIGISGRDNGLVFGSSRGDLTRPTGSPLRDPYDFVAWINNSIVNVGTEGSTDLTTPHIKASLYGGGENGHSKGDATVNVYSGTIGITDTADPWYSFTDKALETRARSHRGNVYGAGSGVDTYSITVGEGASAKKFTYYNPKSGMVAGNTTVNIKGGHVGRNVYGGGATSSVGTITNAADTASTAKHMDATNSFAISWPYEIKCAPGTGKTTVNVTGGRIGIGDSGVVGVDNGNVYGGSRGNAGERYFEAHLANVRETEVNIDYGSTPATVNSSSPIITGSVFGGGEDGHVIEDTHVSLKNGWVSHSLFGGGRGQNTYTGQLRKVTDGTWIDNTDIHSITSGKVYGNTYVEMSGGRVLHNVLGGGYLASVGKGNYAGGADDYSTSGYGETLTGNLWTTAYQPDPSKPDNDPVNVKDNAWHFLNSGKTSVVITGGTIGTTDLWDGLPSGSIFGGSRGVAAPNIENDPRHEYCPEFYNGYVNETEIVIGTLPVGEAGTEGYVPGSGPKIYGSVYGGSQDGHVRRDTHVTINGGEIGLPFTDANRTAFGKTESTTLNEELDNPQWHLRGNVFGAGSGIGKYQFHFNYDDDDYDDEVEIDGVKYKETDYSTSAGSVTHFTQVDINGGTIHRNVYGGGSLASVGAPKMGQAYDPYKMGDATEGHGLGKQSQCSVNIGGDPSHPVYIGTPDDFVEGFKYNSVYGGEVYGASRGEDNLDPEQYGSVVWTLVKIFKGAVIQNNVFGGGDAGMVKKDSEVIVGEVK